MHLARVGHDVWLWARDARLVDEMRTRRANVGYLPDVLLPPAVTPSADLAAALQRAETIVWAVPTHGTRQLLATAASHVREGALVVSATKGLEVDTWLRPSEVLRTFVHATSPVVVLSGPSFAGEVAREHPTAVCAAS